MGEVAPVSAGFQPWIRLVSPTGVLLGNGIGASAVQIAVTAPTGGTYTVIVGTNDGSTLGRNNDTGSYLLRVDGATETVDYNLSLEPTALTIVQGASGTAA